MIVDDYTRYAFDGEIDLEKVDYWIFCAADTPPGHPRTPMFDWMLMNASNWGFNYVCDKLSIPNSKGIVFRSYHGYQFMTVTLPASDDEIEKRSEKFKEAIRDLMERYHQLWAEAKDKLMGYTEKPKKFDFTTATWFEMAQLFKEREDAIREMYKVHYYFSEGLGAVYILFEELCKDLLGIHESDPLFQKLLVGFVNDSNEVDRGLYRLSLKARELDLQDIILNNDPGEVLSAMEKIEAGRQWVKEFHDFLYQYGWSCTLPMDYINPSWIEDPRPAVIHIRQYLDKGGPLELDEMKEKKVRERAKVEEEMIGKVPLEQKNWFEALMRVAQQFVVLNEECAYYEMVQHALTRYVLMGIGKRISEAGCIERPEDIFLLVPEDLYKGLNDPEKYSLKPTVRRRRTVWEDNARIIPPPLLAKVSPEKAGMLLLKSKDPIAVKVATGKMASTGTDLKTGLIGQTGALGVAEGPARVILSAEQLGEVQQGDILVAPATWNNWSPVFSLIKGAIIDRGGILSNAAILGREYGVPVVVNVIDGTSKIKTGQRVKVNGNLGVIHISDLLDGKKVLIADDEPDVLETLEELLPMCDVRKASTFDDAKDLLQTQSFDMAILDIMGIDGYGLLQIAKERNVIPIMLTAHALTLEDTVKSFEGGAASYIPKEEMANIVTFLNDILEGNEAGEKFWWRWFDRFRPYYDKRFGPGWQNKHKDFWEKFV